MMSKKLIFKYGLLLACTITLAISACQKVIDIKVDNAAPQLVIQADLTDNYGPQYVVLSTSTSFTSASSFPPVTGAQIILTDSAGDKLLYTEKSPGLYYTFPFAGSYGKTYTLTVKTGDNIYTAKSTMPQLVPLDSVTSKSNDFGTANLRTINVNYQDPPKVANQYKFVLYVNNAPVNTIFTNDDSFTNGRYVKEELFQTGTDIHVGDTARVDMQCIDKNVYKYWFSLSQLQNNGPGGGITPSNPPSNFNNGALGYFSAHTTDVESIEVN